MLSTANYHLYKPFDGHIWTLQLMVVKSTIHFTCIINLSAEFEWLWGVIGVKCHSSKSNAWLPASNYDDADKRKELQFHCTNLKIRYLTHVTFPKSDLLQTREFLVFDQHYSSILIKKSLLDKTPLPPQKNWKKKKKFLQNFWRCTTEIMLGVRLNFSLRKKK